MNFSLRKAHNIDVAFGILSKIRQNLPGVQNVFFVEQIVEFSAVDFVKGDPSFDIGEVLNLFEDVTGC